MAKAIPKKFTKLTFKQQRALDHFRLKGNACEAYKHAYDCSGMSVKTANRRAKALFDHPKIKAELEQIREIQAQKLDISENRILAEMAAMGFSNIAEVYGEAGTIPHISQLPAHAQRAIKAVTTRRVIERTGGGKDDFEEVEIQKIEMHPKLPALVKIAEIKGMLKDSNNKDSRPVKVTVNISGQSIDAS